MFLHSDSCSPDELNDGIGLVNPNLAAVHDWAMINSLFLCAEKSQAIIIYKKGEYEPN